MKTLTDQILTDHRQFMHVELKNNYEEYLSFVTDEMYELLKDQILATFSPNQSKFEILPKLFKQNYAVCMVFRNKVIDNYYEKTNNNSRSIIDFYERTKDVHKEFPDLVKFMHVAQQQNKEMQNEIKLLKNQIEELTSNGLYTDRETDQVIAHALQSLGLLPQEYNNKKMSFCDNCNEYRPIEIEEHEQVFCSKACIDYKHPY